MGYDLLVWDVFISHASEDKDAVAAPLSELLQKAGVNVWLDSRELKLGDSLSQSIDDGLAKSRYGVVVLSKNFFAKRWPKRELAALVQKEMQGRKVILPIWHGIDQPYVMQFSPTLADKVATSTDKGLVHVASEIVQILHEPDPGATAKPTGAATVTKSPRGQRAKGPSPGRAAIRLRKFTAELFDQYFSRLSKKYPQNNWWIRTNKFRVCIEAILTQGTLWTKVESVTDNLGSKKAADTTSNQ